jgi:hypothetical protein
MKEEGEGLLDVTEFLPSELDSESEFEELPEVALIPKASSEPPKWEERPLFHFMTVGEERQIQTEYRPGYRPLTAHRSISPPQRSHNRPRWSLSQSIQSATGPPPLRDHLLRCVACWLRSVQCQDCVEGQSQHEQSKTRATAVAAAVPLSADTVPRPRHPSPPALPSHEPPTASTKKDSQQRGRQGKPSQPKPRPRSQPRSRQAPKAPPSASSRLRQHTFSTAIAITPQQQPMNKTPRGFHFVNPQPDTLLVEKRVVRSTLPSRVPATAHAAREQRRLPRAHEPTAPSVSPNSNYPKVSSPPPLERASGGREEIIFLTSTTRLRIDDDPSLALRSAWHDDEEELVYIAG